MEARWANQGYIHFKTNHTDGLLLSVVKDSLRDEVYMYIGNDIVYIHGDTATGGHLDVGVGATSSKIDSHSNQQDYTAVTELHSQSPWTSKLEFISTHPSPRSFIFLKGSIHFEFNASNQTIIHYKSLVDGSDDRLKEN